MLLIARLPIASTRDQSLHEQFYLLSLSHQANLLKKKNKNYIQWTYYILSSWSIKPFYLLYKQCPINTATLCLSNDNTMLAVVPWNLRRWTHRQVRTDVLAQLVCATSPSTFYITQPGPPSTSLYSETLDLLHSCHSTGIGGTVRLKQMVLPQ